MSGQCAYGWLTMNRRRIWIIGSGILAAVWLVAVAAIAFARSQAVTADKVIAFVEMTDLTTLSAEQRRTHIEALAARINRLPFEERRNPALEQHLRDVFVGMTPEERSHYLDLVLPRGMQQMMDAINTMPRHERQAMVDRALQDMERGRNDADRRRAEEEIGQDALQRIVDEGLRSYMRDATAEAKLDLEPLILQMQRQMRKVQGR
jgi:hypothetical protein